MARMDPTHQPEAGFTSTLHALSGPYDAVNNGSCSEGHPVNGFGRCGVLNEVQADAAGVVITPKS